MDSQRGNCIQCLKPCCGFLQRAARVAKKEMKGMYKKEFARQTKAMAAPAPTIIPLNG